ncbi:hypothetical protein [Aquirufa ecclesiirivi]|uniref:glycoside hydrolase family 130 protein n=1 Tax=Aquirufa ecclesiirivi TaxID=2715124 RepID=UPI003BAEAC7C
MIHVKKEGILLEKTQLGFENQGVMNPTVIQEGDIIHLFYRAVKVGNISSIGYACLSSPLCVESRMEVPLLYSQFDYESQGLEDPRICRIEGIYYLSYTAYNGVSALGALATSLDLIHFNKFGIIVPQMTFENFQQLAEAQGKINEKYLRYNNPFTLANNADKKAIIWDKNVVFFPRKIKGKFHFIHRVRPDIQLVIVDELNELTVEFWQHYFLHLTDWILMTSKFPHEVSYIGGGCPPIEIAEGWLFIYHGVFDSVEGYVYTVCAALLDLDNPLIELARLPLPLFYPEETWEKKGNVNNVCFPTGALVKDDTLYIYYGAADERIACATLSLSELMNEFKINPSYVTTA